MKLWNYLDFETHGQSHPWSETEDTSGPTKLTFEVFGNEFSQQAN